MKTSMCVVVAFFSAYFTIGFRFANANYTFQTIDYPASTSTDINGFVPDGKLVGDYTDAGGVTHAFILDGGNYTVFDHPSAQGYTSANGGNSAGQVVGLYYNPAGPPPVGNAYLRSGNTFTELVPFAGSAFAQALSINEAGHVVGSYRDGSGTRFGFHYDGSQYETISVPGSTATVAMGINDVDDVVGNYVTSDGVRHGFIRSQGSYTQLDAPGADGITVAQGINEAGDVAGLFFDANGTSHGFVYNGSYTVIDVLGSTWTEVYDIDAAGRLAGYYEDANGQGHGFVATPVPEPGIGTVMLGLTGFFWYRRNRRGVTKKP